MIAGLVKNAIPQVSTALEQAAGNALSGAIAPAGGFTPPITGQDALSEAIAPDDQESMASVVANAVARDLGPSVQRVLTDNVVPGIAGALDKEEVQGALRRTARLLGREVVLGIDEGMAEIQSKKPKSEPSALGSIGALAKKGADLASGVTWALAAVVVVLGGLLLKLVMQARKYRSESQQRDASTRLLDEARRASLGKPWSEELIGALQMQLRETRTAGAAPLLSSPPKPPPTNGDGRRG